MHEHMHHKPVGPQHGPHHDHPAGPHHGPHDPELEQWQIAPPAFADLRPWFDTDEQTAAALTSLARCPAELRILARLVVRLTPIPDPVAPVDEVDLDLTGYHVGPAGTPGRWPGVPVPAIDELARALGGERLAYQAQAAVARCPGEIRVLIDMLLRATTVTAGAGDAH